MIQEQNMSEPHKLENLVQCTTTVCTPDLINRNYCFKVRRGGVGLHSKVLVLSSVQIPTRSSLWTIKLWVCFSLQVTSPTSEHIFQTLNDQDLQSWVDTLQTTTVVMLKKCPQELLMQQQRGDGGNADVMQDGNKQSVDSPNTGKRVSHVTSLLADGYKH